MHVEYISFNDRQKRSEFVFKHYGSLLQGKVLDVGCDKAVLRSLLPPSVEYTGVDIGGNPDIQLNLEEVERLPFEDNAFDCVLCTDVLEHINNLHQMYDELLRVSKKYVVISLPNCWACARQPIHRGRGGFSHYGLPVQPPVDRHKWFFSLSEIVSFIEAKTRGTSLQIKEMMATEKPRILPLRLGRRLLYPQQMRYLNRYAHTLWTTLSY